MTKNPNLPNGSGYLYVKENVQRALTDLCCPNLGWRERILEACANAHRPNDNEFFTGCMSDEALQRWRECSACRFGKNSDELTDAEISSLGESLRCYITSISRDMGIIEVGLDPKDHNKYGSYYLEDPNQGAPRRNTAEQ